MGENNKNNDQQEHPVTRWLRNAVLGAAMADQPAMMTASGWRQNEKGDYVQDQQNDPHVKQLRDNLAAEGAGVMLGEFGLPAIHGLYNLGVRGLGRVGNNWARAKLISKEMKDIKTPIIPDVNQTELLYQPVKQYPEKTSLKFYERPQSSISEAERKGIPKTDRNNIVRPTNWGNLRFIRNIGGLPQIINGKVMVAPESNMIANFTTDLPFRIHEDYSTLPGREYMLISPQGFVGKHPIGIDPMDTMFPNKGLTIDPEYVTIVSGSDDILQEAQKQGFKIQSSDKLKSLYKTGSDEDYTYAMDELLTQLGRPSRRDYRVLEGVTGLKSNVENLTDQPQKYLQYQKEAKNLPLVLAKYNNFDFKYPDGTVVSTYDFIKPRVKVNTPYKHVFYNPIPTVENDLMLPIGLWQHPQFDYTYGVKYMEDLYNRILNLKSRRPIRKQGGKF